MSFASRLRQAMDERGMSQAELSMLTGIGKSSISQYKSGKNVPHEKAKAKIAAVLDCTPEYLDEKTPSADCSTDGLPKITVAMAAKRMGVSVQFVRVGIVNGRFDPPIGTAVKMSSKWTFCIPPKRLENYLLVNAND